MKNALILSALWLIGGVDHALAQNATFTAQTYPIIGNTHTAADFNGDGKLDLAGPGLTGAAVMLNNGNGTFAPKTEFPVVNYPQDVAAGDFNGDGKMDLAVSLQNSQLSLAILLGTGTGSFGPATYYPNAGGFDSPYILTTDLNNDAKLDVVIMHGINCFTAACTPARIITVFLGNGDGTFQPGRDIDVGTSPSSMAVGDFNRDGRRDLAVGAYRTEMSILLGNGDGSFAVQPIIQLVPGGDVAICNDTDVADLNGDGFQDIVAPMGNGDGIGILLGNGDGTFRFGVRNQEDAVSAPQGVAIADYNGDGVLDIARGMGDGDRGLFQIMYGNGDGTFQPVVRYAQPPRLSSIAGGHTISADFNGDGKPDIALEVRGASPRTDIYLNGSGATVPPTARTITALTLNPSAVPGGNASTGTITLSARAQTATTVQLSSSSVAARVPASLTVTAGALTANFSISTSQVSSATTAQITATANRVSRVASLTISAPVPATDTVSISRAEYDSGKRTLRIEASSTRSNATLQAFVTSTSQLIGNLTNNGGKYSGQFTWSVNPQNVTVRSNLGGASSRAVSAK